MIMYLVTAPLRVAGHRPGSGKAQGRVKGSLLAAEGPPGRGVGGRGRPLMVVISALWT